MRASANNTRYRGKVIINYHNLEAFQRMEKQLVIGFESDLDQVIPSDLDQESDLE